MQPLVLGPKMQKNQDETTSQLEPIHVMCSSTGWLSFANETQLPLPLPSLNAWLCNWKPIRSGKKVLVQIGVAQMEFEWGGKIDWFPKH